MIMLAAAGIALATLLGVFSEDLFLLFLLPSWGWWAILLLLGGLLAAKTKPAQEGERGMQSEGTASSKSP
jgi:hypothetical protein